VVYVGLQSAGAGAAWMYAARLAVYPLSFVGQTVTIWLTVLVAASRCLAVCWPAKAGVYCSLEVTRIGEQINVFLLLSNKI